MALLKRCEMCIRDRVGGALMVGFEKAVVKAHGASDSKAFYNAMELAYQMVKMDVVTQMKEGLKVS